VTVVKTNVEKLDALQAPELKSELVLINKGGAKNIVLDLTNTRYCDSSGLSAVLVANRLCRDSNGSFVLCGLQPTVEKLITISQLDAVLKITPTVNEAVDLVYMEEVERDIDN
jgi:anti-anti-sigma factor